ncbi:MAG: YlbF family regulator [Akkermansiaceae bacterium]|nr:YlbF family regulator [Akkermansiaceae bacterium]
MNLLEDNSAVMLKTRDLCETIANDSDYKGLLAKVEKFLGDDEARLTYQSVHERGQELNQKQQSGLELAESEIAEFESARSELLNNSVASEFIQAQQSLEALQSSVSQMVGMTLELGRVPTEEDIAQASSGGCCGGESKSGGEGESGG